MKFFRFLALVFLIVFTNPSLFAGSYSITPSTYLDLGLTYQNTDKLQKDDGFYYIGSGKTSLIISGLRIANGNVWTTFKINLRSTGGAVDIEIRDNAGVSFYKKNSISSSSEIDLSGYTAAKSGEPIVVVIVFYPNVKVDLIEIRYSGRSLYAYPSPYFASAGKLTIVYDLPNASYVTLKVYDGRGKLVKTIAENRYTAAKSSPKENPDTWDGKTDSGQRVASGLYFLRLFVREINATTEAKSDYEAVFRLVVFK
ncbi:MAG: hypothetical protein D6767_10195 [Candidatus Hydrogenedentota bacterium]|nr:MAG: hypothetical protein D6767_10195 [Candidatus Hydrogenedentota bacterium]